MSKHKEMRAVVRDLKRRGFLVVLAKSGHYRVENPITNVSCQISASPSSDSGVRTAKAQLKRDLGYDPRAPKKEKVH